MIKIKHFFLAVGLIIMSFALNGATIAYMEYNGPNFSDTGNGV